MKNDNHAENKNIFPIRIPQAKNMLYWLIGTVCLYIFWVGFVLRSLEFFGFILEVKSGQSSAPSFISVLLLAVFSFAGYLWRFTLPASLYQYPKGKFGEATLSLKWHVIASLVSAILFLLTLWWSWGRVL
ncbi:hypothetical protein CXF72_18860 [Psychromonas sp. MB-3u-54]|uniref:hypothetical protein n=1 Tax=Psychromonas sp. MB-3u-54 TaxID=2058319 RepID=UPI000C34E0A2|nr:hypothetical protein [Psychromonas sp. MB-3u-54]PKH01096.1 hypothetical protein CXF72_18860 [Psychromonas sp. MB-3u-54]